MLRSLLSVGFMGVPRTDGEDKFPRRKVTDRLERGGGADTDNFTVESRICRFVVCLKIVSAVMDFLINRMV